MKLSWLKLLKKIESIRVIISLVIGLAQYLDKHYSNDKTIKETVAKLKKELGELQ